MSLEAVEEHLLECQKAVGDHLWSLEQSLEQIRDTKDVHGILDDAASRARDFHAEQLDRWRRFDERAVRDSAHELLCQSACQN